MIERQTEIELEGRQFILHKLPAAKSFALLVEILTKALPISLIGGALEDFVPAGLLNAAGKQPVTAEELEALQLKLLQGVEEVLPAGPTAILDSQGHFKVPDLEDDMLLFGQLLVKVVGWQYKDFFTGILSKLGIALEDPEALLRKLDTISSGQPT
jgi:hypothetical protein